jgi:Sigma-70, region 4
MATVRLPVLNESWRPQTRADCARVARPCPFVGCRHNLLVDPLEDGSVTLNYKSRRLSGADRAIPPRRDADQSWFVIVSARPEKSRSAATLWALGPCDEAPRARAIASSYEAEFGKGTAIVTRKLPDWCEPVIERSEGSIDSRFADEVEDAIEEWFDEPDPTMPSCVLDEVSRVDRDDDDLLLEQIAKIMHVSRERVRQVETAGLLKLKRAGLTLHDVLDED